MGFDDRMKEITDTMSKNKIKAEIRKHSLYEHILIGTFIFCLLILVPYTVLWVINALLLRNVGVFLALLALISELYIVGDIIMGKEDSILNELKKSINEKDQKEIQTKYEKRR